MNQQEHIARIAAAQEDVRKFVAEQHKLMREPTRAPWQLVIGGMVISAILFGAGAAFMKLIGA